MENNFSNKQQKFNDSGICNYVSDKWYEFIKHTFKERIRETYIIMADKIPAPMKE